MKKTTVAIVAGVALLGVGVPVFANNHADSQWAATLPTHQGNVYTGARAKTDASSAYIKLNNSGQSGINAWLQLADGTEVSSPKTRVLVGQERFIINYAFERHGHVDVRMAIESDYNNPVHIQVNGVWSPDSV